ncbi:hypothetical protein FB451DRAFT_1183152 [Mycena latifolia]|nr:hypothetical protein FB451DRAFT_1183152 [Mycena latifolia]
MVEFNFNWQYMNSELQFSLARRFSMCHGPPLASQVCGCQQSCGGLAPGWGWLGGSYWQRENLLINDRDGARVSGERPVHPRRGTPTPPPPPPPPPLIGWRGWITERWIDYLQGGFLFQMVRRARRRLAAGWGWALVGIWQREKRTGPEYPIKRTRATGAASGDCGPAKGIYRGNAAAAAPDRGRGGLPSVVGFMSPVDLSGLQPPRRRTYKIGPSHSCREMKEGISGSAVAESEFLRGEGTTREAGSRQYPTGPGDCGVGSPTEKDVTADADADADERRWICSGVYLSSG